MKERPILFSSAMVRAILDGRKTQTRRVPTSSNSTVDGWHWSPERFASLDFKALDLCADDSYRCGCLKYLSSSLDDDPTIGHRVRSIYDPGDRLWVRETLRTGAKGNPKPSLNHCWRYSADNEPVLVHPKDETAMRVWAHHKEGEICVSIHMPRWASRITLEIIDVRVQRVQEISEEDAIAEGVEKLGDFPDITPWRNYALKPGQPHCMNFSIARRSFESLWNSINGKKHPWAANPWVWAITFKRIEDR